MKDDKPNINIQNQNLLPIPRDIVILFENFLNSKGITDYQIEDLRTDPTFPFAALDEIWKREGLSYGEFMAYVHSNFQKSEDETSTFLARNGVLAKAITKNQEPTLREVIVQEYGERLSAILIFYSKILLSSVSDQSEEYIDSSISDSSSQLLAIVQALKEKTNNVDQLRTLDMIEHVLEKYNMEMHTTTGNVLTPEEKMSIMPSLTETNKIFLEEENSATSASWNLIDVASRDRIPKYEFRVGKSKLPPRSQQKMDYVIEVISAIDHSEKKTNYARWMPGFFDAGGDIVNSVLSEAMRHDILESFFTTSIDQGLQKYSTLDADNRLREFLASSLARDLAEESFNVKGVFKTLGEIAGSIFTVFGNRNEGGDFETNFTQRAKKITKDAMEKGYIDKDGNYVPPINADKNTIDFASSAASTAALEGMKSSVPTLNSIPTNVSDSVAVNPMGDFYPNSLGSVIFPDKDKGLAKSPLEYSESVPSMIGDKLNGIIPSNAISAIQKQAFESPEIFSKSRFDGSFANNSDFQKNLADAGLSNYKLPQIQNAVNSAFQKNNFDSHGDNFLSKLNVAGNELMGNVSERLNLPYSSNDSPLANFLPLAAAPFASGGKALGKAGVDFLPGNPKYYRDLFDAKALATKPNLPDSYEPNTMSQLMKNEAPFAQPIPENKTKTYTPEQLEQYKKYQDAVKSGQYGKGRPKPNRARNAAKEAQNTGRDTRRGANATPISGPLAGATLGFALGAPGAATLGFALTGIPAAQFISNQIFGIKKENKWQYFTRELGDALGITGLSPALRDIIINNIDGSKRVIGKELDEYKGTAFARFWNGGIGNIFGKIYVRNKDDLASMGRMVNYFNQLAELETDPQKKKDYQNSLEAAQKLHRLWYTATELTGDAKYNEQFKGIKRPTGRLTGILSFLNRIRGFGGSYSNSFFAFITPIRKDSGVLGGFLYFYSTVPKTAIGVANTTKNFTRYLIGLLPKGIQNVAALKATVGLFNMIDSFWTREDPTVKKRMFGYGYDLRKGRYKNPYARYLAGPIYNGYFWTIGKIGTSVRWLQNPEKMIEGYLKNLVIRFLTWSVKNILHTVYVKVLKNFSEKILKAVVGTGAKTFLLSAGGCGCLLVLFFIIIATLTISTFGGATKAAYVSANGTSVNQSTVTNITCNGIALGNIPDNAVVLDVPYFNQVIRVKNVSSEPDRIAGGGNMCSAASSAMVAAYYRGIPLTGQSQNYQDYMYKDEAQSALGLYGANQSCSSVTAASTGNNIQGAFYVTSNGLCDQGYFESITKYLKAMGLNKAEWKPGITNHTQIYNFVKSKIDTKNPVILSISEPLGHIFLAVGYVNSTDGSEKIVVNDPYRDQSNLGNGDYNNNGNRAVYDLSKMNFVFKGVFDLDSSKGNRGGACIPGAQDKLGDVLVQNVPNYKQKYPLSCEIAALSASLFAIDKKNGSSDPAVLEDKIKTSLESAGLIDKTPVEMNGTIVKAWGDPNKGYVGDMTSQNGTFINYFLKGPKPEGYGVYSPVIKLLAEQFGAKPVQLQGTPDNLAQLYKALDTGSPSVVWVPYNFYSRTDSDLASIKKLVDNGTFSWLTTTGTKVAYTPDEHAMVLKGYNQATKSIYLMDVYSGKAVTVTVDQFLYAWSFLNYQAVIIGK